MLTAVLLLLLPAVLGMSVFRIVQLPRDLLARRTRINPKRRFLSAFAFIAVYILLTGHTALLLIALARLLMSPPQTIADLFSASGPHTRLRISPSSALSIAASSPSYKPSPTTSGMPD